MSQNLSNQRSSKDLQKLDRPDVRPLLDPSWMPEAEPHEYTIPLHHINFKRFSTNTNVPGIRRRDIEDFRRIWLKNIYGETTNSSLLHGHWKIDSAQQIGDSVIPLVQYRSFAVCVRGGWETVVIKPADINEILGLCLQYIPTGEMPHCKGSIEYNAPGLRLQWRLLPVELVSTGGLRDQVRHFEELMDQARRQRREVTQIQILAEFERRMMLGHSERFVELLDEHGIDWGRILRDPAIDKQPPDGYEALLDGELERLFNLPNAGTTRPCPLPLKID